jgi:hypothetical protein
MNPDSHQDKTSPWRALYCPDSGDVSVIRILKLGFAWDLHGVI